MTAACHALAEDPAPGVLDAADPAIPGRVRARYGDYARAVNTVVPVIGVAREEWWLFDNEGLLLDVLCRHA